jgi:hypothetical protein
MDRPKETRSPIHHRVPDATIRAEAVRHGCHPASIRKRLRGLAIKGLASARVERAVAALRAAGYQIPPVGDPSP